MPQKYIRKTNRRSWSQINLTAALLAIDQGQSCNSAAARYEILEATLRRYINKRREGKDLPEHGGRHRDTFSVAQSECLATYIRDIDRRAFGLTKTQLGRLVFEYAEQNDIPHRFNKNLKMAGKDWIKSFLNKYKISLRTPEATSVGRLIGFNEVAVQKFFTILKEVREKYNFDASQIYNADESGLSSVPTKLPKILSPTGSRRVARIVTAERGKNTTIVCAVNALGNYVPPFFIFKRMRMKDELLFGAPPGLTGRAQQNGWMSTEIFLQYLKHFQKYTNSTPERPILLLVDNHSSHISLDGINFCRENGIVMVGFPPHTTHRLQPLDVSFFGPLKTFFSQECDSFVVNKPNEAVTDKNICQIFNKAYLKAATVGNAVQGFRRCGIEPFDSHIFGEEDFAAAKMSEREISSQETVPEAQYDTVTSQAGINSSEYSSEDELPLIHFVQKNSSLSVPGEKLHTENNIQANHNFIQLDNTNDASLARPNVSSVKRCIFGSSFSENAECSSSSGIQKKDISSQCCVKKSKIEETMSLWKIRPFPTYERSENKKGRKIDASIITGTPMKRQLEEKLAAEKQKEEAKILRKQKREEKKSKTNRKSQPKLTDENKEAICPGCNECFEDPPREDWIQCSKCQRWWHDSCTDYSGVGTYKCDLC